MITRKRLEQLTCGYPALRVAVVGDFCLDRYLEIDPSVAETSLETGLPVHNVMRVRAQPGGAGTIVGNLAALGVGRLEIVGFAGDDGEGYELRKALQAMPAVQLDHFLTTRERRTFTYCKPLLLDPNGPPRELNRLDSKNWTATPSPVEERLIAGVRAVSPHVDAIILLDQVEIAEAGVVTSRVREAVAAQASQRPGLLVLADSRRSLRGFSSVSLKMNGAELAKLTADDTARTPGESQALAASLAVRQGRPVFVTLAERGIVGAEPNGRSAYVPAWPVRGPIDIVGAGDAVTANLVCALAAHAEIVEAMEIAMAAASIVIHQLGTTGTASTRQMMDLLA